MIITELADIIEEQFPPSEYRRVLDVAGGNGELAIELWARGYADVCIVDPAPVRREQIAVRRRRKVYHRDMAMHADLVVGYRPDSAAEEMCDGVVHAPVLIVPCCNYWDADQRIEDLVVDRLLEHGAGVCTMDFGRRHTIIIGRS